MPRKAVLRKNHTRLNPKLKGRKEEFVKRAMGSGIRSIEQLSEFTGLSIDRIKRIEEEVKFSHRAVGEHFPQNAVEKLLINGELSVKEITKLTGKSVKVVQNTRSNLRKKGVETAITTSSSIPPLKIARTAIAYRFFRETARLSKLKSRLRAMNIDKVEPETIDKWFLRHSDFLETVKKAGNGRYYKKALEQMQPWLKERGKEFKPTR